MVWFQLILLQVIPLQIRWALVQLLAVLFCVLCPRSLLNAQDLPAQDQDQPAVVALGLEERLSLDWEETIRPLLRTHCGECHMDSSNEGGVNLDDYQNIERIREHGSTWEQVRGVIRAEAMPPPESSQLSPADRNKLTTWIQTALHDIDCGCSPPTPAVTLRRLNQVEYDNTVRDLLGLDITPSKSIGFVSDDVGNGFDNQGEVLTLPPIMLEKYLLAGSFISKALIETDREQLRKQRFDGGQLLFSQKLSIPLYLAAGEYDLVLRMEFGDSQPETCKARIAMDGATIGEHEVKSMEDSFKHEFVLEKGEHLLTIEYLEASTPEKQNDATVPLHIQSIRLSGPGEGLPAYPKHHEMFAVATPSDKDAPDQEAIGQSEAARRVFHRLLPRAYRRPVSDEEVQAIVSICEKADASGFSYEESLRFGLQAVLVSPNFLFRTERIAAGDSLDDFALATRLSYFLWSTMPDDDLFALARLGKLREPGVLKTQVSRMLESPKSEALLKGFFAQWLGLRNLSKIDVDRTKFPGWNERLQAAMIHETELFCGHLLRHGSIDEMADANYTFVNPRMAEFYGFSFEGKDPADLYRRSRGKRGASERRLGDYDDEDKWIRVELQNNRKGLLTHASILALTSNPTRTSPVKRGKWILENVLGDPPPSAPPGVPALEQAEHSEDMSLRRRLEIHRSNPSCAGCHKLMDPIGLGLENFDVIGRWRELDGKNSIDAKGELSDGQSFEGPAQLVALLSTRKPQIAENFVTRMLTYALGRGLQREDKCDIERILKMASTDSRSIRSIVEAIVMCDAFQQKPNVSQLGKLTDAN